MTAEEFLFVLVLKVFDHEEAANIVDKGILHRWVELNRIRVLAVVAD